ncbi:MAG: hypothetical protein IKW30_10310 [Lachnospiraceae bacterium]|nr:hypothetical protein [Lachnospiraceae bacterium]
MNQVKKIYQQYKDVITQYIFPLILFLYPFMTVNQGVDVSDSTYSFSNFLYFENMEGMWVVSTYVSNVVGWLLTKLPLGTTVLGLKFYATFLISGTVLLVYFTTKKWMPAWIAFLGEMIAVGFCWIPAGILYNYLSYFFFTLGAILLYRGLVEEKDKLLVLAGVTLGCNVFVRIPNVTEMALIIGLWYYLACKQKKINVIIKKTLICLFGYVVGVAIPLIAVLCRFGIKGILDMIQGLTGIQSTDGTYSAWSMILTVIHAYQRTFKWMFVILLGIAMGTAMFFCFKGKMEKAKKIVYLAGVAILLRFLWGRGMFSFRYYEDYSSVYEWGMMGLYLVWIAGIYMLVSVRNTLEEKLWAVLVLVITVITPLGSNNYTFQNLNNLFLVAPFTLYTFVKIFRRKYSKYSKKQNINQAIHFPWKAMITTIGIMICIQSVGFHSQFVFRDGMDGTKREYRFEHPATLRGMKTTKENGKVLGELISFIEKNEYQNKKVLLYGDCPGLSFLLDLPVAIGTSWPDLGSYPYETFVRDIEALEEAPMVILREVAIDEQSLAKKQYLINFLNSNEYVNVFGNDEYSVFVTGKD